MFHAWFLTRKAAVATLDSLFQLSVQTQKKCLATLVLHNIFQSTSYESCTPSTTCRKTSDAPISCSEPMASLQLRVRPCLRLPLPPLPPLHLHFHHFHHFRLLLPLPNPQTISLPALESVDPKPTLNAKLRIALSSWHFMTAKCQNILPISPPWRLTKARRSTDFRIPKHIKIRQYRTEWRVSRIFL